MLLDYGLLLPIRRSIFEVVRNNRIPAASGRNTRADAASRVSVIPSEVEESLADFSDIVSVSSFERCLDFARHDKRVMGRCTALIYVVRRNLERMAVGIAEINRVRDFVILKFEFDSALL